MLVLLSHSPSLTPVNESAELEWPGSSVGEETGDSLLTRIPQCICGDESMFIFRLDFSEHRTKLSSSGLEENIGFSDRICDTK